MITPKCGNGGTTIAAIERSNDPKPLALDNMSTPGRHGASCKVLACAMFLVKLVRSTRGLHRKEGSRSLILMYGHSRTIDNLALQFAASMADLLELGCAHRRVRGRWC